MQKLGFILFGLLLSAGVFAQTKATKQLFNAIEKNNLSMAQNAILAGADPDGVDSIKAPSTTVLIKAVQLNRLKIVDLLLKAHANVNIQRPVDMHTPLMVAAHNDYSAIADLLIQNGADVNVSTLFSRTALHMAARQGHTGIVLLLKKTNRFKSF